MLDRTEMNNFTSDGVRRYFEDITVVSLDPDIIHVRKLLRGCHRLCIIFLGITVSEERAH